MGGGTTMKDEELIAAAREAAANAYAPYSDYPVGAALRFADGAIVTGTNIENASYGLSLCAETLAVAKALRACGVTAAGLKWPNDVLVDGRKISGILLELAGDPADVCHVVIGIGINVNMLVDTPALIDQPWTSVRQCLGHALDRNQLAAELLKQLRVHLSTHWQQGFAGLREEWEALHVWRGRSVALTAGSNAILGVVQGVDERGAIRLSVDGVDQTFSGGELSLRLQHDS